MVQFPCSPSCMLRYTWVWYWNPNLSMLAAPASVWYVQSVVKPLIWSVDRKECYRNTLGPVATYHAEERLSLFQSPTTGLRSYCSGPNQANHVPLVHTQKCGVSLQDAFYCSSVKVYKNLAPKSKVRVLSDSSVNSNILLLILRFCSARSARAFFFSWSSLWLSSLA